MSHVTLAPYFHTRPVRLRNRSRRPLLDVLDDRTLLKVRPATVVQETITRPLPANGTSNHPLVALLHQSLRDQYPSHLFTLMNRAAELTGILQHQTAELIGLLQEPPTTARAYRQAAMLSLVSSEHIELIGLLHMHIVELKGLLKVNSADVLSADDRHELSSYLQRQNTSLIGLLRNDGELIALLRELHPAMVGLLEAQHSELYRQLGWNTELMRSL